MEFALSIISCLFFFGLALFWAKWINLDSCLRRPDYSLASLFLALLYLFIGFVQPSLEVYFPLPDDGETAAMLGGLGSAQVFLLMVVTMPIIEEYIFRWVLPNAIGRRLGILSGVAISSFLWAVLHMQYDAFWVSYIFIGGLALGGVATTTKSIYPVASLHVLNNLLVFFGLY